MIDKDILRRARETIPDAIARDIISLSDSNHFRENMRGITNKTDAEKGNEK